MNFLAIRITVLVVAATMTLANAEDSFKVVSYNIRFASRGDGDDVWPNRADTVAATIAAHDVAGLQEVTHAQLQDLLDRLDGFESYSVGRNDGQNAGEHTTILYRRDRLEANDRGTFWLSETPHEVGSKSWDAAITRICSWVILRDKATNKSFYLANTHFDHRGATARLNSGILIRKRTAEVQLSLPIILMGDFNCLPDSQPYRALLAESDQTLVDVRSVSQSTPTGPNSTWCGFKQIEPDRVIDHIFVDEQVKVESVRVLNPKTKTGRFASDHLPVQAIVRFF